LFSDVVEIYDGGTGQWSAGQLSQARFGMGSLTIGNKLFFAGGFGDGGASDVVDIYDAQTGQWTISALPEAAGNLSTAAVGDKAIFLHRANYGDRAVAYFYDTVSGQWSTVPVPDGCSTVVTVGSRVFFPGGSYDAGDGNYAMNYQVAVYDDQTGTWSTTRMPETQYETPSFDLQSFCVGNQAVVVMDGALKIYDDLKDRWSTVRTYLDHGVAVAVGNQILVCDGEQVTGYDLATGASPYDVLSQPRKDLSAWSVGTKAVFAGGIFGNGDFTQRGSDVVDVYDTATGQWSTTTLSQGRQFMATVVLGNEAIIAGGNDLNMNGPVPSRAIDFLTDSSPAPVLIGTIVGNSADGIANVEFHNSGDAALAAPFALTIYAARDNHSSQLLGKVTVHDAVPPGTSARVEVSLSIPDGFALSDYRLVAAAGAGRHPAIFASRIEIGVPKAAIVTAPTLDHSLRSYVFTVSYYSPYEIDGGTLEDRSILVTGPNGYLVFARLIWQSYASSSRRSRVVKLARYQVRGTGQHWSAADNGIYTVHFQGGRVRDRGGYAGQADRLGTFTVAIPPVK
jgi:hypothetical protein